MIRQGDVLLIPVNSVPESLQEIPKDEGRVILAYGEVTGHAHVVEGEVEFLTTDLEEMAERFLRVESGARLVHEEHATIDLAAGDYKVIQQVEYQPGQAPRPVRD